MERIAAPLWNELERSMGATLGTLRLGREGPRPDEVVLFSLTPERLHHPGSSICGDDYTKSGVEKHFRENVTVRRYLEPQSDIHCFTFSPYGSSGMTMDGLTYANDRWVFVPRPWEVTKQ